MVDSLKDLLNWAARTARGEGLHGRLSRSGAGSLAIQVASMGLGFLLAIVLARALSVDGYGLYSYVFALITVLSVPAKFGLPVLIVREVARARVEENWGAMRGIIRWCNVMAGTFAVVLAAVAALGAWIFADHLTALQVSTFAWALLLVPPMVLGEMRGAALRGLGRVFQGQLPERVLRPAFLILLCVGLLAFDARAQLAPDVAMALHALAAALAFLIGAGMFLRVRPDQIRHVAPVYRNRDWLSAAWPLALAAGMQILNSHTDIIMLGMFRPAAEVGVYRAAAQLAGLVGMALIAINQVVAPQFAALYARGEMQRLQRLATGSSRLILAMAAPVGVVLILFGTDIMRLLFGEPYAGGHWALALLVLGQLSNAAFGSVAMLLNMSGHESHTARGVVIAEIFNVLLNLVLIPAYGSVGAAAATALTITLWNAILWYEVRRHLGINSAAFAV